MYLLESILIFMTVNWEEEITAPSAGNSQERKVSTSKSKRPRPLGRTQVLGLLMAVATPTTQRVSRPSIASRSLGKSPGAESLPKRGKSVLSKELMKASAAWP